MKMNRHHPLLFKIGIAVGVAGLVTGSGTFLAVNGASGANAPHATKSHSTAHASNSNTYYWLSQDTTLPLFVQNDLVAWKRAGQLLHVQTKVAGPTGIDLAAFITTINEVCAQHPAGVTIVGWDPSEVAAVNQCIKEGVPTVTDDANLPTSNELSFVGTNWYDIGVALAKGLITALPNGGQVATLSIENSDNMTLARSGFAATLKGTNLTVVANENDNGDPNAAATATASLLSAYPNLKGVAGFDAQSGIGALTAIRERHDIGKVKISTVEQTPAYYQNIKTGAVSDIIIQSRTLFTFWALMELYYYHHSGINVDNLPSSIAPVIPSDMFTGLVTIDKSNINSYFAAQKK